MATPTTSSNATRAIGQTAQYIVEKWTRDVQQPFDKQLQMAPLVNDRSGLVADGGDTINVPFAIAVDSRAKSGGSAVTYDVPNGAPITIAIDKHYYSAVLIEDILKVQASYELRSVFQERMAESLARQVDTDLHALYGSTGTDVSAGASVDDADMITVVYTFDANNTPSSMRRGVVGHNTKADLLGVNKYVAYDQTGKMGKAIDGSDGLIASVYNMDIYHSGNVPTSTTGRNLFFHKAAVTLAKQQAPKFEAEYSVDYLGWKTVLHTIYGLGVERSAQLLGLTRTTAP